ncbi:MAG: hypothetical protein HOC72_08715, partial [Rhodospirillaceae bacterium]|nr:hypothetical protein [Rhodospirillaceae bacterium]
MARMPNIIRQILRKGDASEEQEVVQTENAEAGQSPDNGPVRDDEASRTFWQTVASAGEASESAQVSDRADIEQQADSAEVDPDADVEDQEADPEGNEATDAAATGQTPAAQAPQAQGVDATAANQPT